MIMEGNDRELEIKKVLEAIQMDPGNITSILREFIDSIMKTEPIMITKQAYHEEVIEDTMKDILTNKNLHSLTVLAPYVSSYLLSILAKSTLKKMVMLVNKDEDNPDYVNKVIEGLKKVKYRVIIMQRPPKSSFIHMKMMIPYLKVILPFNDGTRITYKEVLVPSCVICGSVNYTRNGIVTSDEMLVVLRNKKSIVDAERTLEVFLRDSSVKYDSQKVGK